MTGGRCDMPVVLAGCEERTGHAPPSENDVHGIGQVKGDGLAALALCVPLVLNDHPYGLP
jgi:hypothetical protein